MDIKERLSFFQEMVQCEYPLHLWHYSPEFELIETDCPAELMLPDIISMLGFSSLVLAHIESGNRMPLILDTAFGSPVLSIRALRCSRSTSSVLLLPEATRIWFCVKSWIPTSLPSSCALKL